VFCSLLAFRAFRVFVWVLLFVACLVLIYRGFLPLPRRLWRRCCLSRSGGVLWFRLLLPLLVLVRGVLLVLLLFRSFLLLARFLLPFPLALVSLVGLSPLRWLFGGLVRRFLCPRSWLPRVPFSLWGFWPVARSFSVGFAAFVLALALVVWLRLLALVLLCGLCLRLLLRLLLLRCRPVCLCGSRGCVVVSACLSAALSAVSSLPVGSRVGVVGSREFPSLPLVREFVSLLPAGVVVVSGGARGVDECAASSARARGLVVDELPFARGLGPAGGPVRNRALVRSCSVVVGFSCGSSGTEDALACARRLSVPFFRVSPPVVPGAVVQASLF